LELGARGGHCVSLAQRIRALGADAPDPGPDRTETSTWRTWTPLERVDYAVGLHFRKDDALAAEVALLPRSEPEYSTAWNLVRGVVFHSDALATESVLFGSKAAAMRCALDSFDAALADIPEDEFVGYNRAVVIRNVIVNKIDLGPGWEDAWASAEEFFRRWHEAHGTAETRANWLQTLRVRYQYLGERAALAEALPILGSTEQAEIVEYTEDCFDGTLVLLTAAGDYARAYEAVRDHGLPKETKAGGPMHLILLGYLGAEILERGQPADFDKIAGVIDRYESELSEWDLGESRHWLQMLRDHFSAPPIEEAAPAAGR